MLPQQVTYNPGELELEYVERNGSWQLRLISPRRRNGVKVFVQVSISPESPAKVWGQTFQLLHRRLVRLQGGHGK